MLGSPGISYGAILGSVLRLPFDLHRGSEDPVYMINSARYMREVRCVGIVSLNCGAQVHGVRLGEKHIVVHAGAKIGPPDGRHDCDPLRSNF
jgi:hypothetical protein